MDNAKSSEESRVGGIGPPGEGSLLLEARSGGGRRPGIGHCELSHSNATSLIDLRAAAYH
jgi:hypothetical protein